jgi:hypothetical protein
MRSQNVADVLCSAKTQSWHRSGSLFDDPTKAITTPHSEQRALTRLPHVQQPGAPAYARAIAEPSTCDTGVRHRPATRDSHL